MQVLYCEWCKNYTHHKLDWNSHFACEVCIQRAMKDEEKYLDKLRTSDGYSFATQIFSNSFLKVAFNRIRNSKTSTSG